MCLVSNWNSTVVDFSKQYSGVSSSVYMQRKCPFDVICCSNDLRARGLSIDFYSPHLLRMGGFSLGDTVLHEDQGCVKFLDAIRLFSIPFIQTMPHEGGWSETTSRRMIAEN